MIKCSLSTMAAMAIATLAVQSPAHADVVMQERVETQSFALCLVERKQEASRALLAMDIGTEAHERALNILVRRSSGCLDETNLDSFHPLRLSGALAEALMAEDVAGNAITNLADPMMEMTRCVSTREGDAAMNLLRTGVGTTAEAQAAMALSGALNECASEDAGAVSVANLRAMIAIVAYQGIKAEVSG